MLNRDSWGHSYLTVRGEILGFVEDGLLYFISKVTCKRLNGGGCTGGVVCTTLGVERGLSGEVRGSKFQTNVFQVCISLCIFSVVYFAFPGQDVETTAAGSLKGFQTGMIKHVFCLVFAAVSAHLPLKGVDPKLENTISCIIYRWIRWVPRKESIRHTPKHDFFCIYDWIRPPCHQEERIQNTHHHHFVCIFQRNPAPGPRRNINPAYSKV